MTRKMTWIARIERLFPHVFRLLLVGAFGVNLLTCQWLNAFTAVLTFMCTFLPYLIARKNRLALPESFQLGILLFLFASMYLGELREYYLRFWWWDLMLHTCSGIILGFIGFLLIFLLNTEQRVNVKLSPFFLALFSFTFAVSVGAVWEIFEFSMDSLFGTNMQKSGLVDTMSDLVVDTLGALFTSSLGYIYALKERKTLFQYFIHLTMSSNE